MKNKTLIWVLVAVCLASQKMQPVYASQPSPQPTLTESPQRLFSPQALAIVKGATRVDTFRLIPPMQLARLLTARDPQIAGCYVLSHGRPLSRTQAVQMTNALLNQQNYPIYGSQCIANPGFAFRFWRGKKSVFMTICFECGILNAATLDERGHVLGDGGSGFFTGLLVAEAKQGFPTDPVVQSLKTTRSR